jgi:hypothetical protein
MSQDPFPESGHAGEEPDGFPLPPAAAEDGPGDDDVPEDEGEFPAQQGLFVCLPAEQLTLAGFAQNGEADTMAPGPLLGTIVYTVTGEDGAGLVGCDEDQLVGILSAGWRLEARAAWTQLAAIAAFAARRQARGGPAAEFAADELAAELHLTPLSAAEQMAYASDVTRRLPKTFAALGAGLIHPVHLRIIQDETFILKPEDAARADELLSQQAPGLTFGELRHAAHKLILKLDPEAALKRKEAAKRDTHVRPFREASGNAGMVGRELPSDEVLASWQHVEQRALDLRAAGVPGTLRELRVRAYLDLLQERDSRAQPAPAPVGSPLADPSLPADNTAPADPSPPSADPGTGSSTGADDSRGGPYGPDSGSGSSGGSGDPPDPDGPRPASGPSLAALVTITVPLATLRGQSDTPGRADGFGLLDADDARDLVAAAARHPRTRWCLTAVNPDGTAAAHGCATGRHPPPGPAPTGPAPPGTAPPGAPLPFTPVMLPVTRGPCDHPHAEVGYHPSRKLQHLIRARNARCTAPGCGRPAVRCDLDHTVPWDQGGLTCECDLAPLCRHHHRCKQADGWTLEQPQPGVLVWRVPNGRTYATTLTQYPRLLLLA